MEPASKRSPNWIVSGVASAPACSLGNPRCVDKAFWVLLMPRKRPIIDSNSSRVINPLLVSTEAPGIEDTSLSGLIRDTRMMADVFSNSENTAPWLKLIEGMMASRFSSQASAVKEGSNNQTTQLVTPRERPQMAPVRLAPCQ